MFEIGQRVVSRKIGTIGKFEGVIVSVGENYKQEPYVVVQDNLGRSFHREFSDIWLPESDVAA